MKKSLDELIRFENLLPCRFMVKLYLYGFCLLSLTLTSFSSYGGFKYKSIDPFLHTLEQVPKGNPGFSCYTKDQLLESICYLKAQPLPYVHSSQHEDLVLFRGDPYSGVSLFNGDVFFQVHHTLSNSVIGLSESIDTFFVDEEVGERKKASRLRVRLTSSFVEGEGFEGDVKPSFRLVFPRFEKKIRAIGRRMHHFCCLKRQGEGSHFLQSEEKNNHLKNFFGGYGLHWDQDLGIRMKSRKLDPFMRGRVRKLWLPTRELELLLEGSISWFKSRGWEYRTGFEIDRRISEKYLLHFDNHLLWTISEETLSLFHGLSITHRIDSKNLLIYGSLFESERNNESSYLMVERYRIYAAYQRSFYRGWVSVQVRPELILPRERSFRPTPGIYIQIESLFGGHKGRGRG